MSGLILRNFASEAVETTFTSGITVASTACTLTNNSGWPDPPFAFRVEDEAILCTESTGNTLKGLTRGYDGTSASAHSTSVDVYHVAVGDDYDYQWRDPIVNRPRGDYDDEFSDDSKAAAWTEVTPTGTATWTESKGMLSCLFDSQDSEDIAVIVKSLPVLPPYDTTTAVRMLSMSDDFSFCGLVYTDGVTSGSNAVALTLHTTDTVGQVYLSLRHGQMNSLSTNYISDLAAHIGPFMYLRLRWSAVNLFEASFSPDGVTWIDFDWADLFLTFTPTHAGLFVSSWGSNESKVATFEYFRGEAAS